MGGWGSGRWRHNTRVPAEECYALDVNQLHKDANGPLRPGTIATASWTTTRGGDAHKTASIGIVATENGIKLSYSITDDDGPQNFNYPVRIVRIPCNYGGTRPYFVCPGIVNNVPCNRRVAKLYKPPAGSYFLCRHCYNLTHHSCNESGDMHTAVRRTKRAARKLGLTDPTDAYIMERPKGMHTRTFQQLRQDVLDARERERWAYVVALHNVVTRSEKRVQALERQVQKPKQSLSC